MIEGGPGSRHLGTGDTGRRGPAPGGKHLGPATRGAGRYVNPGRRAGSCRSLRGQSVRDRSGGAGQCRAEGRRRVHRGGGGNAEIVTVAKSGGRCRAGTRRREPGAGEFINQEIVELWNDNTGRQGGIGGVRSSARQGSNRGRPDRVRENIIQSGIGRRRGGHVGISVRHRSAGVGKRGNRRTRGRVHRIRHGRADLGDFARNFRRPGDQIARGLLCY